MKSLRSGAIRSAGALLCFRRGRNLLLRLGFGLRCFPPNRRDFRRHFLAIQISDAAPAFNSHPMLLTHAAFYRAEDGSAQREISGQCSDRALAPMMIRNRLASDMGSPSSAISLLAIAAK